MTDTPSQPAGTAWGCDISDERKRHLGALLEDWEATSGRELRPAPKGATVPGEVGGPDDPDVKRWLTPDDSDWPFGPLSTNRTEDDLTGADVFWLAARALAGAGGDIEAAAKRLREARQPGSIEVLVLSQLQLQGATMMGAQLDGAFLRGAHMQRAVMLPASLRYAELANALLTGASLDGSDLDYANIRDAQLSGASLEHVSLRGADLSFAHLEGASLRRAIFDSTTDLSRACLHGVLLDQAVLGDVNLTVVDWSTVLPLGDETEAESATVPDQTVVPASEVQQKDEVMGQTQDGDLVVRRRSPKPHDQRADEYRAAGRAYRALSVALRSQGIPREPTRFHYQGELMERRALSHQARDELARGHAAGSIRVGARWTLSFLLGTLAGYGDRLGRLALTYIGVVLAFTALFLVVNYSSVTLSHSLDSLSLSVTAFHGRGLLASSDHIASTGARIAIVESVMGLFVEALFIAAFTRRVIAG